MSRRWLLSVVVLAGLAWPASVLATGPCSDRTINGCYQQLRGSAAGTDRAPTLISRSAWDANFGGQWCPEPGCTAPGDDTHLGVDTTSAEGQTLIVTPDGQATGWQTSILDGVMPYSDSAGNACEPGSPAGEASWDCVATMVAYRRAHPGDGQIAMYGDDPDAQAYRGLTFGPGTFDAPRGPFDLTGWLGLVVDMIESLLPALLLVAGGLLGLLIAWRVLRRVVTAAR